VEAWQSYGRPRGTRPSVGDVVKRFRVGTGGSRGRWEYKVVEVLEWPSKQSCWVHVRALGASKELHSSFLAYELELVQASTDEPTVGWPQLTLFGLGLFALLRLSRSGRGA